MVVYQRIAPPEDLAGLVEHLWMVEGGAHPEPHDEILIPNGRPGLAVALGVPGTRHDPITQTAWPNEAALFGIMTRPHVLTQTGASSYAGAELTPWAMQALGRLLVDDVLPLNEWVGAEATAALAADLREEPFGTARAGVLVEFLRDRVVDVPESTLVERAVRFIDENQGRVTVTETAAATGASYSTLYRVFMRTVGIGPKQYAEIQRYYHFVGGLLGGPADAAATVAALHGYYDQAHAARDFKRYTGVSATSFRAVQNGIAALMHGRSVQDSRAPDA
ncbi:helix-turn-helix domain-containing protein [Kribbella sp. NPDC058245]|uniref:helix-turn-helix domain-containing protein n=1 Tax=Kribbella sp. NPDC058245 TaxID=3346399 RepID=UPI0036E91CAB